jgi:hypothetical protein
MSPEKKGDQGLHAPATHHRPGDGSAVVDGRLAYAAGYQRALTLAAERVDELDAIWRPIRRPTYEEKVAERVAQFSQVAAAVHARWGTRPWPGLDNGAQLPGAEW